MGEIIFHSLNVIKIQNNKNFGKRFQLTKNKVKDLNKIYFKIKKNINTGLISILDIKINNIYNVYKNDEKLLFSAKNSQELQSLVKRVIND
jgi:hypothetical protein